jgi:hypothetical protein
MLSSDAEVVYCQPDPEYRRATGESQSHLKSILVSPAHYDATKRRKFFSSSVMTIGTATHCKALEGDDAFEANFVRKPDNIKYTTKEGRDWRDSQGRKTILVNDGKDRQWDSVVGMTDALRQLDWFDPSQEDYRKYNEVSIYWQEYGIPCKARLDRVVVTDDEVIVLDLKTTDSVSFEKFQTKMVDLGYDFQAAWYTHAAKLIWNKPTRFVFVAIERNEPHTIDIFEVSDEIMREARFKNESALKILKECRAENQWPTRQPSLKLLEYPRWYKYASDAQPIQKDDFVPLF